MPDVTCDKLIWCDSALCLVAAAHQVVVAVALAREWQLRCVGTDSRALCEPSCVTRSPRGDPRVHHGEHEVLPRVVCGCRNDFNGAP